MDTRFPHPAPDGGTSALRASARTAFFSVFPYLVLPIFLAVVDQTIVAAALPEIARDLGDVEHVSLVVVAYLIAATVAAPVYGRLGDVMGRRRMMVVALGVLIAGSCFCALATNMNLLILGRAFQGLGGGGLMALANALIGEHVEARERARYQGYNAAVAVCSTSLGPVAGGLLSEQFGWRAIFVFSVPVALIALLLVRRIPASAGSGRSLRFDVLGLFLLTVFVVSALFAMREVQAVGLAVSPTAIALFAVGIVAVLLLVRWERRAPFPLLPISLLRSPAVWRSDVMAACHGAMLVSLLTLLPMYYGGVRGRSAFDTGLLLLPMTIGLGAGALISGQLMAKTGRSAVFVSWGAPIAVVMLTWVAFTAPRLGEIELAMMFALITIFMGTVMGTVQLTVQVAAGRDMLGAGAASVVFSRAIGAGIGTAFVSAVLFAAMAGSDLGAAQSLAIVLDRGSEALQSIPPEQRAAAQADVAGAFQPAFLAIAAFGVLTTLMAWTMPVRRI